ncbi:MAG: helix-turn-helix domain-containing protein [Marinilabiliales bacterium]|nr:helix-turn-helix domain-containing protein [Marinilabiliales bacterium]
MARQHPPVKKPRGASLHHRKGPHRHGCEADTLPPPGAFSDLPVLYKGEEESRISEELLYKVLFDMKRDMNDLRQLVLNLIDSSGADHAQSENAPLIQRLYKEYDQPRENPSQIIIQSPDKQSVDPVQEPEEIHDTFSLEKQEIDYIRRALQKHEGKRKDAALELGISERTLYRRSKNMTWSKRI